jgi:hypothetical protein
MNRNVRTSSTHHPTRKAVLVPAIRLLPGAWPAMDRRYSGRVGLTRVEVLWEGQASLPQHRFHPVDQ